MQEPLAPYYARRALAAYPGRTPLAGLAAGFAELARGLPVGSGAALLVLQRLAGRAGELLAAGGAVVAGARVPDPRVSHVLSADPALRLLEVEAGLDLVALLAQLLLLVDLQILPAALEAAGAMVAAAPPGAALGACDRLAEALAGSDDYARKAPLVLWYQRLAAATAARQ